MKNTTLFLFVLILLLSGCGKSEYEVYYDYEDYGEKLDFETKLELEAIKESRGYKIVKGVDEKKYVYIGLGAKPNLGYGIELTDVSSNFELLTIKVKDTEPPKKGNALFEVDYPALLIETTDPFLKVNVIDGDGEKLKRID